MLETITDVIGFVGSILFIITLVLWFWIGCRASKALKNTEKEIEREWEERNARPSDESENVFSRS